MKEENGYVTLPDDPAELRGVAGPAGVEPKPKAANDYEVARKVIESWGKPIAGMTGELWEFTVADGWQVVTNAVRKRLNEARGRNAEGCAAIAYTQVAVPQLEHKKEPCHYWERVGGVWEGKWVPFRAEPWHVLYTDYLHDLRDPAGDLNLSNRVIFGPLISMPYAEEAPDTSEIEAMVDRQNWSPEVRDYFQRIFGQILQPHVHSRRVLILWGVPHSGKSTLATAFGCAPNGLQGFSQSSEATLVRDKWAALTLVNRFCNVSDDSAQVGGDKWVAFMKAYTSGTFTVEPKYMKPTTVSSTAKLVSTCNDPQALVDASGAAEMRVCAFRFTRAIERTDNVEQEQLMTSSYWSSPLRRAGVLEWLTEGLRRMWATGIGVLKEPEEARRTQREMSREADPVLGTLKELLIEDPEGFVPTADIVSRLPTERRDQGRALEMVLSKYMGRVFPSATPERRKVKGTNSSVRGYKGVSLCS